MKKLKYLFTLMLAFALVSCFTYVHAEVAYKAYNRGDKIVVNLNDNLKGNFYVLADSDTTNNTITAVYETTLGEAVKYGATANGFDGSEVETNLKTLTSTWTAKNIEIRLLTAEEVKAGINFSKDISEDFTEPTFLINNKNYWLGDVAIDGDKTYPGIVNYWNTYSTITVAPEDTTTAYIRPVITITKDLIEGENKTPDYATEWNKYVEFYKDNDMMDFIKYLILGDGEDEDTTFDIQHTENSLKVIIKDTLEEYITNFTYKDGVISYVEYAGPEDYSAFDQLMVANAEVALVEYKGFDLEKFEEWLENSKGLTLEKDGIEVVLVTETEKDENGTSTTTYMKSFKADITHDFATYQEYLKNQSSQNKPSEDTTTEKNPTTGLLNYGTIALASVIVAGGIYLVVRKKNKLPHA